MERIVVGVDGSDGSTKALQWAADEARLRHAALDVVHAWQPLTVGAYPYGGATEFDPRELESAARAELAHALSKVDPGRFETPPNGVLHCGAASSVLIEASKDATMVVVGSRGRGGFAGLLLGSVSQQVLHHAHCPVVVVH